jgi:hypothetical protein
LHQRAQQIATASTQAPAPRPAVQQPNESHLGNQAQLRRLPAKATPAGANLILQRKCACGAAAAAPTGECAECNEKKPRLQTKLRINEPGDAYGQKADRIADEVMAAATRLPVRDGIPRIQARRHSINIGYAQRKAAAKERKRLRERERRRRKPEAARGVSRVKRLAANGLSRDRPWQALRISRRT